MHCNKINIKKLLFFFLLSQFVIPIVNALESESDYMNNIQNFIDSIQTYRFRVEFKGKLQEGFEGVGQVDLNCVCKYDLLYDKGKNVWKYSRDEDKVPIGEFNEETFNTLHIIDKRTTSKSKNGIAQYIHRDAVKTFGNVLFLYREFSKEKLLRYRMQYIDPVNYIRKALPRKKCEYDKMEETSDKIILRYKIVDVPNGYKVVELSKKYGYLPIRIANEGDGWNDFRGGVYKGVHWDIAYEITPTGYVVNQVSYKTRRGEGHLQYEDPIYNSDIADDEFQIDIPTDAMIVGPDRNIIAYPGGIDDVLKSEIRVERHSFESITNDNIMDHNSESTTTARTYIDQNSLSSRNRSDIEMSNQSTKNKPSLRSIALSATGIAILGILFFIILCTLILFYYKSIRHRRE